MFSGPPDDSCQRKRDKEVNDLQGKKKPLKWIMLAAGLVCAAIIAFLLVFPHTVTVSVNAADISSIEVFDGNTGRKVTVTEENDLEKIAGFINEMKLKRGKISVGRKGYRFDITINPGTGTWSRFILNSEDTVRNDPFFYNIDGGTQLFPFLEGLFGYGNDDTYHMTFCAFVSDIDGDGAPEDCSVEMGPTSGLFTVIVTARSGGEIRYRNTFNLAFSSAITFEEKDGAPYLVMEKTDDKTGETYSEYHRLSVEDRRIVLDGLDSRYEWYWGGPEWNLDQGE